MKKLLPIFLLWSISASVLVAQTCNPHPKLVVGIVVDQMRFDYLERYKEKYGEGGFKRILGGGFSFKNAHFDYVPTETAPGTLPMAVFGRITLSWWRWWMP